MARSVQGPRTERKVMRKRVTKSIAFLCAVALLTSTVSPAVQAGELKPLKGWGHTIATLFLDQVPDDPYLQEITATLGPPSYIASKTEIAFINVAGTSEDLTLEIGYFQVDPSTGRLVDYFFQSGVTVTANGDTIEWTTAGVVQLEDDSIPFDYTLNITGGTGRFEGAWGIAWGHGSGPDPIYPNSYEGVMSTVGSLK